MKTAVPLVALAATASATFTNAPPFPWPGNIDNHCTPQQQPGFDWSDLDFGDFFSYKDFFFKGWKCEDDTGRRSRITPRTFGKAIGGVCTSDKSKSLSFGAGPNVDKFSLSSIFIKPEFDTDLEFHYDMPDGTTCKHRSPCKAKGTKIVNNQCGGAKNVTIVIPPKPDRPKPTCSIKVPTISFDCSTASKTKPPKTRTSTSVTSTSTVVTTTTSSPDTTTSTAPGATISTEASSTSPSSPGTPSETSSIVVPSPSTPGETSSAVHTTESLSPSTGTPVTSTVTFTTSFDTTSTIFTTTTQTITQCEPTKTDCPGNSVTTTTVTIAVSTTVCPVTEVRTTTTVLTSSTSTNVPVATSTGAIVSVSSDATSVQVPTSAQPTSGQPTPGLPCPSIVPSCLNTFLFTTGCTDNTDAACYCPDATFVKNVYDCLYAHGPSDEVIAEAIAFFQGICGKYLPENPGIATDATVTSYITVTASPSIAPVTTVTVVTTTVVPCTDDNGSVIPSSSSTVTISTSIEAPQLDFTTGSSGTVDVVPITSPGSAPSGTVSPTGITTVAPTATTVPTAGPTQSIVTAGSGRAGVSLGLAAAVAAVVALAM